jgi:putative transposase
VIEQTFHICRKFFGGMQRLQLVRSKELEKKNQRLQRAVSDINLDKLILTEAGSGNF